MRRIIQSNFLFGWENLWCCAICLKQKIFECLWFLISGNKMVQLLLRDLSIELAQKYDASLEWTQNNYTYLIQPAFYGVLVSLFTMMIIYFDSDVPGVNPPTPFSPRKANQYVMMICDRFQYLSKSKWINEFSFPFSFRIRYAEHREKTNNLGFLVSIGSGVVTFFLLYL